MRRPEKSQRQILLHILLAGTLTLVLATFSSQALADEPASTLKFEVVGGESEKPIENASIYVKFTEERTLRRDKHVEWRTKSNRQGLALIREVRRGKVLIQVIATGWKTYGKFYDINENEHRIRIRLEKPRRWY